MMNVIHEEFCEGYLLVVYFLLLFSDIIYFFSHFYYINLLYIERYKIPKLKDVDSIFSVMLHVFQF